MDVEQNKVEKLWTKGTLRQKNTSSKPVWPKLDILLNLTAVVEVGIDIFLWQFGIDYIVRVYD